MLMPTVFAAGFADGCLVGMVAVAIVVIFRTSGVVNFAQGEFMTVAAYFYIPWAARHDNSFETLLLTLLVGAVMGAVFFAVTEVFLAKANLLMQMMATFALSLLIVSVLGNLKGNQTVAAAGWFKSDSLFYVFRAHLTGAEIIEVVAAALAVVSLALVIRYTPFGKDIEAVSEDRRAASLSGISPKVTVALCWMIGGAITAVAGILYAPLAGVTPSMGDNLLFPAFVAATLGGFSSVPGAAGGGIAVGLVSALTNYYGGGSISTVAVFAVLIVVLLVKPSGFGGKLQLSRV
jgi:branched-chain amino acid transport system permease protein